MFQPFITRFTFQDEKISIYILLTLFQVENHCQEN